MANKERNITDTIGDINTTLDGALKVCFGMPFWFWGYFNFIYWFLRIKNEQ